MKSDRHERSDLLRWPSVPRRLLPHPQPSSEPGRSGLVCTGEQGHGCVFRQADGNVEESLRSGSEPSHTPLAGKPAAACETGPRPRSVIHPGAATAHAPRVLAARGYAPSKGKWKPETLRHLPPKTQLAYKRAGGSGEEAVRMGVQWLGTWTREPEHLDPDPTTHWLCGPWAPGFTSPGLSFLICPIGIQVVPSS